MDPSSRSNLLAFEKMRLACYRQYPTEGALILTPPERIWVRVIAGEVFRIGVKVQHGQ